MDLCIDLTGLSTTARMRSEGRHGNVLSETGNNHQRLRVCFFTLFVHTLSFSATTVFNIETVQMHNSTTDTIKDTYYVFRSIQQILTICMFDFSLFYFSKHKYVCPPSSLRLLAGASHSKQGLETQRKVVFSPSVVGDVGEWSSRARSACLPP